MDLGSDKPSLVPFLVGRIVTGAGINFSYWRFFQAKLAVELYFYLRPFPCRHGRGISPQPECHGSLIGGRTSNSNDPGSYNRLRATLQKGTRECCESGESSQTANSSNTLISLASRSGRGWGPVTCVHHHEIQSIATHPAIVENRCQSRALLGIDIFIICWNHWQ